MFLCLLKTVYVFKKHDAVINSLRLNYRANHRSVNSLNVVSFKYMQSNEKHNLHKIKEKFIIIM